MNNLHTNIPENTILINRKIVFENEPASFENKRIEISDMLLLKKSSLSIKNCTVIFEGENAAIVGVESKSMVFENCVFSSKETFFDKNCKTKIVSHITEPQNKYGSSVLSAAYKYGTSFTAASLFNKNNTSASSIYTDITARLCGTSLLNEIKFNNCKFLDITGAELFNARITNSVFENCDIDINSPYISDCTFTAGNPLLYINEFGDINDLKAFLADNRELVGNTELVYSYQNRAYKLQHDDFLLNKELFTLVKILIGTRALNRMDMLSIISKLKKFTSSDDRKMLDKIIRNEIYNYNEIYFDCKTPMDNLWQLCSDIDNKKEITITYHKMDTSEITRRVLPASIMFSEYYFYLIAFHMNGEKQEERFYRIDRITNITEHRSRQMPDMKYNEGELRKYNQYMFPGKKMLIKFSFTGPSVQAVLDKLPTARVVEVNGKESIIEATVYGDGIKMFLLSQGSWVKVISPKAFADEMKEEILKMKDMYH